MANGPRLPGVPRGSAVDVGLPEIPLLRTGLNNRYPVGRLRAVGQKRSEGFCVPVSGLRSDEAALRWRGFLESDVTAGFLLLARRNHVSQRRRRPVMGHVISPLAFISINNLRLMMFVFFIMTAIIDLVVVLSPFQPEPSSSFCTLEPCQGSSNGKLIN